MESWQEAPFDIIDSRATRAYVKRKENFPISCLNVLKESQTEKALFNSDAVQIFSRLQEATRSLSEICRKKLNILDIVA